MTILRTIHVLLKALRCARPPLWRRNPIRAGCAAEPRTILVTGATGFVGRNLCRRLIGRGERLIVLTRDHRKAWNLYGPHVRIVTSLEALASSQRIDVAINLAGARIIGIPWTRARRRALLESRLRVTNELVAFIARLDRKPKVLISASAIGYYGVRDDEEVTEAARGQPIFQSHLCQTWELAAQSAENYGVRVCRLRFGLVLGDHGGAFPGLVRPARFRTQLLLGSGAQWISWIHMRDLLNLIDFCIERDEMRGGVNATAPQPARQAELAALVAARFGRSIRVRIPAALLRLTMGEMSQLLVDGQRVLPTRALCAGFEFRYGDLESALDRLLPRQAVAEAPIEIMYESQCPVCDTEIRRYCEDAKRAGIKWRVDDVGDRADLMVRYGLDTQQARKRVYVLTNDGRMVSGMQAIVLIWSALPGWRRLARVARLPFVRTVLDAGYDLVLAPLIWQWSRRRRARIISMTTKQLR